MPRNGPPQKGSRPLFVSPPPPQSEATIQRVRQRAEYDRLHPPPPKKEKDSGLWVLVLIAMGLM